MQTPSTVLRHPPWSKGAGNRDMRVCSLCKLQALFYNILLGVVEGCRKARHWSVQLVQTPSTALRRSPWIKGVRKARLGSVQHVQTPSTALRHPPWSKGAGKRGMRVCSLCKLQALLYDILLGGNVPESGGLDSQVCVCRSLDCCQCQFPQTTDSHTR